jgi:hypothetical protein
MIAAGLLPCLFRQHDAAEISPARIMAVIRRQPSRDR